MRSQWLYLFSSAFLFLFLFLGPTNVEARWNDRNLLQRMSRRNSCNRPRSYLCDCEEVPPDSYFSILQNFAGERLRCSPLCGRTNPPDCVPQCDQVICYGSLGVFQEICGTLLDRDIATSIRNMDCSFDENLLLHVCVRDDARLEVDRPTYKTVTEGHCVPGCGVTVSNLNCTFPARFFGDPFIFEEPPIEPPEVPPVEPPEIPPIEPPIEPPEFPPDVPPVEPPEEITDIPIPEPDEILEEPPVEPPDTDTLLVRIDIPIDESESASLETSIYYGEWSNCTDYCSQTGPRVRRRRAMCRNSFGVPVPMSECETFGEPDVVEECPFVTCVGEFYYVLGDWSECSQECASFNSRTGRMSVGTRERELICLYLNGTMADTESCMDLIEAPELDLMSVCGAEPCQPVRYMMTGWGRCSCETESRIRQVTCVDLDGNEVEEQMCEALDIRKPRSIEFCLPRNCP